MKLRKDEKHIGNCGVYSGQLILVDPCYLNKWKDGEVDFDRDDFLNSYDEACKLTTELGAELQGGQHSIGGAVFSTGYGDGEYPVIAKYKDDRIKSVRVEFF